MTFFASGILDLSWHLNDENSLVTLWEFVHRMVHVLLLFFKKGELGTPLTRQEMAKFYSDLYKVDLTIPTKTIPNGFVIRAMFIRIEKSFLFF